MKQRSLFSKPKSESPKPVPKKPVPRSESRRIVEHNPRFTQPLLEKAKLTNPDEIKAYEAIQRHRLQLLIWSRLYYEKDISVVPDCDFDRVGHELVELQAKYPQISKIVAYAEEFEDWDASTGYHLPIRDPWVVRKAEQILKLSNRRNDYGTED